MAERKKTFKDHAGNEISGTVVEVQKATELFSEILLKDGTLIRIKPVVTEALRIENSWDNDGNPMYVVRSANVIVVDGANDSLKRKSH